MNRPWLLSMALLCASAFAQTPPASIRIRGTIEKIDAKTIVVRDAKGVASTWTMADDAGVTAVRPIDPSALQSGTFVGTTAVPRADGSLSAVEVHVFPEAARGTGEGHRPNDREPGATMTNATVTRLATGVGGRTMTLRYKDGEKVIQVPDGVPIVTLEPGDRSMLVPGAKVVVTGQTRDGQGVMSRAVVGRDGFTPPM
jgi:hypothetical protein